MIDPEELRRLLDKAPSRPWRYREGAHGDPYGGPDYTALEVQHPQHGWTAIAEGDYDSYTGQGLILAAEAVNALPELLDAVEALERLRASLWVAPTDDLWDVAADAYREVGWQGGPDGFERMFWEAGFRTALRIAVGTLRAIDGEVRS